MNHFKSSSLLSVLSDGNSLASFINTNVWVINLHHWPVRRQLAVAILMLLMMFGMATLERQHSQSLLYIQKINHMDNKRETKPSKGLFSAWQKTQCTSNILNLTTEHTGSHMDIRESASHGDRGMFESQLTSYYPCKTLICFLTA